MTGVQTCALPIFASEAQNLSVDPVTDPGVMCSIIDIYHRVFPYFTKEWVQFMPVILGNLLPLVDVLPPVTQLGTFYNLQPLFLRSLPPALKRLVVCHFHFEKYDQQHRFAATRFHSNLQLV